MSRCLRFPPPGYEWNGLSGEALLKLIEIQRERVKAEREKKEKKRRRKKEKKKETEQGEIWVKKRGHHRRHKRSRRSNECEGIIISENHRKSEYQTQEITQRSSLTEELDEQPVSDSLYESSDNSQSIPRKRNTRSCNGSHNHGSLVQIDFQLQKHKTPEGLSSKPDCSIRMMDSVVQKKLELPVEEEFSSASGDVQEFIPPNLEEHCHSSQRARLNMGKKSKMTQMESQFKELIVNWIPRPLQIVHFDVDDQEWLFEIKPPGSDILEAANASKDVLHHGNSMSCPCDLFLLHFSTIMDLEVQKKLELDAGPVKEHISSATNAQELATPTLKLLCPSSSHGVGVDTDEKSKIAPISPITPSESQFRVSMVNWLPPSLQLEPFDQDWLLKTKQPKSDIGDISILHHQGNFTQYPYAQNLPHTTNMRVLPYTILY